MMELVAFYVAGTVTIGGSIGVVTARNIVYAALFLLGALIGVAGLFLLLYAPFLALVQILIYGGAVTIVILFALMLTRSNDYEAASEHNRWPIAGLVSMGLFGLMLATFVADSARFNTDERMSVGVEQLGVKLFENWVVPFETASLVLLVALIGAVLIGRIGPDEDSTSKGEETEG